MGLNEYLVLGVAAGVCAFYAVMVFASQRRKRSGSKAQVSPTGRTDQHHGGGA